jgi:hypothetical protein
MASWQRWGHHEVPATPHRLRRSEPILGCCSMARLDTGLASGRGHKELVSADPSANECGRSLDGELQRVSTAERLHFNGVRKTEGCRHPTLDDVFNGQAALARRQKTPCSVARCSGTTCPHIRQSPKARHISRTASSGCLGTDRGAGPRRPIRLSCTQDTSEMGHQRPTRQRVRARAWNALSGGCK